VDWLRTTTRLTPRQLDLIRCRARLMAPKEIARELGLQTSYVRRVQASILSELGICDGERGLLRWVAERHAGWLQAQEPYLR
jgi:DNA-binding NarL/FixJ family response regulator